MWTYVYSDELYHHGIKGQKWGVRRYQNKDGSYTTEGKIRYEVDPKTNSMSSKGSKRYYKDTMGAFKGGREYRDREAIASKAYIAERQKTFHNDHIKNLQSKKRVADELGQVKKSGRIERRINRNKSYARDYDAVIKSAKKVLTDREFEQRAQAYQKQQTKIIAGCYTFPVSYTIAKSMQQRRIRERLGVDI